MASSFFLLCSTGSSVYWMVPSTSWLNLLNYVPHGVTSGSSLTDSRKYVCSSLKTLLTQSVDSYDWPAQCAGLNEKWSPSSHVFLRLILNGWHYWEGHGTFRRWNLARGCMLLRAGFEGSMPWLDSCALPQPLSLVWGWKWYQPASCFSHCASPDCCSAFHATMGSIPLNHRQNKLSLPYVAFGLGILSEQ